MGLVKDFLLGAQVKADGANMLPFPRWGAAGHLMLAPQRTNLSTAIRRMGDPGQNSAAFAVLTSMARAFSEPPIREYEYSDGQYELVDDSESANLLSEPNPYMESEILLEYAMAAIATNGTAYLHKVRNLLGEVIQIWPLYPAYVEPVTLSSTEFITRYDYHVPGTTKVEIPAEDVIRLYTWPDPEDHRRGYPLLKPVLLDLLTDEEASKFTVSLLHNLGVPGVVLTPTNEFDQGPDDPAAVAREWKSKFTGERRGEPFVVTGSLKPEIVSFSPEQMDLKELRRVPEERVSAVLGWPAILSNLGAGLTATSGRGESKTLRENATESTLLPLWRIVQKQITRQLLREFDDSPNRMLRFDLSEVRALSEDKDAEVARLDTAIQGGWALVSEGRRVLDLPVEDAHEVFLRNVSQIPVRVDEDPADPFSEGTNGDESDAPSNDPGA